MYIVNIIYHYRFRFLINDVIIDTVRRNVYIYITHTIYYLQKEICPKIVFRDATLGEICRADGRDRHTELCPKEA